MALTVPDIAAADAGNWVLQNDAGLIADRFGSSDTVFLTGVQGGGVIPASDVYVTPNQDWTTLDDVPLTDISNPDGVPNTVVGFEVVQQPIYLPHLRVGSFDVVVDKKQDRTYDAGLDQVIGQSSTPGFTVFFDGNATQIDKERLKAEYAAPWQFIAVNARLLASSVQVYETLDRATHDAAAAIWTGFETALNTEVGVMLAGPAYNPAGQALQEANRKPGPDDLAKAADDLEKAAEGIRADPPDSKFTTVAPYAPPTVVQDETFPRSPFREYAVLTNRFAEAAGLSVALLHTVERFDGAVMAGDQASARMQANAMNGFAGQLQTKLTEIDVASAALSASLSSFGLDGGLGAERDQAVANQQRLRRDGFTPDEVATFQALGLTDTQIAKIKDKILALPLSTMTSLVTELAKAPEAAKDGRSALFDLGTQASNIADAAIGQPPLANPDNLNATTGAPSRVDVLANDTDPEGGALSVTAASDPAHGSAACSANGSCDYTSDNGYEGEDSFTYTVRDPDGLTARGKVSVTVGTGNHRPVAAADSASVAVGGTVTIRVLENDTDADGDTLTVASATQPAHGSVTCPSGGTTCSTTASVRTWEATRTPTPWPMVAAAQR
jgi:Bacterial Ig domain